MSNISASFLKSKQKILKGEKVSKKRLKIVAEFLICIFGETILTLTSSGVWV